MDKGAHFFNCDFQVHSPRDANWGGGDAVSDSERKTYAEELVLACRRKGLGAIAITDHHDFAFFPYIKKAATDELDDKGRPVPPEKQITIFPGLELTLTAPSCQAILILDADFPENLLQSVLTALAISPSQHSDSKHAQVQRIPQTVVSDLSNLYERLNGHSHIKGRFIVLPNVSETGHGTMLRTGFGNFYKSMPSVGGYTDGPVSKFGKGNLSIVSGENREYGFKAIAVFQTSDNRKRSHADLGSHTTWVKWSEPTAEALRQACLAKESRLSHGAPELPTLWIDSVSVSNSKFLGRLELSLNPQYNAIIGGRGTGKSTILEYLRWGLCDQPVDYVDADIAPVQTRRKKLIDDTLMKFDGEVIVTFILNGVRHILKRSSRTQDIALKIGDGEFNQTTEQDVRNLFAVQAYSQKQLSSVGVRIEELRRFIELPIKQRLDQIRADIRDTEAKIRSAFSKLVRKKEVEADIAKYETEVESLSKQLTALRKALTGLSDADQATIKLKTQYDNEELIVEALKNEIEQAAELVESTKSDLKNLGTGRSDETDVVNVALIKGIREKYAAQFASIRTQAESLSKLFSPESLKSLNSEVARWETLRDEFGKKYEAAKVKASANQQQLRQIQVIEKRVAELKKLQMANRNTLAALGEPKPVYDKLRTTWGELHMRKIEELGEQCAAFSALSNGLIQAEIARSLDTEALKRKIKLALTGLNVKEQKIDDLCRRVQESPEPMAVWNTILQELQDLSFHDSGRAEALPRTKTLDTCGFISTEKARIVAGLSADKWIELSLVELEFSPRFAYCTNKETSEYIDFADASAGQQATALLTVLLNQQGAPLVIDQPEDDVDSKMSPDIVQQIWNAKRHRQVIFASHNANFVVNGDAELVVCCDYVKAGDQTGGRIKLAGAIDKKTIRDEITAVTEGGERAFKLRKEKYGF
ncbi:MAG TPA: AAA family ATPase [Rhizomicrobium sp.]|jgi:type III restriction enzyme